MSSTVACTQCGALTADQCRCAVMYTRPVTEHLQEETSGGDSDRPYPDGIVWDEAWRQRQRADQLERRLKQLEEAVSKAEQILGDALLAEDIEKESSQ